MRRAVALMLLALFLCPRPLSAEGGPTTTKPVLTPQGETALSQTPTLREAVARETRRLACSLARAQGAEAQPPAKGRSWMARHPVWFGTLVGAGAGAASSAGSWNELYCASGGDEDCVFHGAAGVLFGAGLGAGIGALVGLVVSK